MLLALTFCLLPVWCFFVFVFIFFIVIKALNDGYDGGC